jgi:hypothetical protein
MEPDDYQTAWQIISTRDLAQRDVLLGAVAAADRRPFVVIAMVKIGALLSLVSKVTIGFSQELADRVYPELEEGILNITDQIYDALEARGHARDFELMETIVPKLIKREQNY